jgi:hypothetical protein
VLKETIAKKLDIKAMNKHEESDTKHNHAQKTLTKTVPQTHTHGGT